MIKRIKLQHIRTFANAEFEFSDGVNLVIGPNGSGKTTLLESIALFAFGSYQSVSQDVQVVAFDDNVGRIEAHGNREGSETFAECVIIDGKKIFKVLTNKIPASKMIGYFKAVLFNPETIDLVSGAPHVRRRELDLVVAQKKRSFVRTLLEYKNVLKQRNQLIKLIVLGNAKEGELDFWDGELVRLSHLIVVERKSFLKILNADIAKIHGELVGKRSNLSVKYQPSCDYARFEELLAVNLEQDLRAGLTLYGPHRDDFSFELKSVSRQSSVVGRDRQTTSDPRQTVSLREHASRGEQRLAAIAFKMETKKYLTDGDVASSHPGLPPAEAVLQALRTGDPGSRDSGFRTKSGMTRGSDDPILIFDDVFSELDEMRRKSVAGILDNAPFDFAQGRQIFISATDERVVPERLKKKARILRLP